MDLSFDYVLSAIGVMFTADHERAANELVRVCRPGGTIGTASWTPTGFVGAMLKLVSRHAGVSDLRFTTTGVTQRFPSPEFFADFFLTFYGPTLAASKRLPEGDQRAFRDDLVALASGANRATDGTLVCDWELLTAVATKA